MRFLLVFIGLCLAHVCAAAGFDPFSGPTPIVVFIGSNPWAAVIGSDTPRVAIYENGDVIFAKQVGGDLAYRYVKLDKEGLENVRVQIAPIFAIKGLKPLYDVTSGVTDQPTAMFYFRSTNREVATMVYGMTDDDARLSTFTKSPRKVAAPPGALLDLHAWLRKLDYPQSTPWTPKYIEVMLWGYSYAPDRSILWPKGWPSLSSERAFKRGDSYSIFLDASSLPELRKFLATRREKGAVEIDGKKMAVSYRFVFPGEPTWRKSFGAAMKQSDESDGG